MSNDFNVKRFLFSLIENPDIPPERKIFDELTVLSGANQYYPLAKKAVERIAQKRTFGFKEIDGMIHYVLGLASKMHQHGHANDSAKIINLLVEDDALLLQAYDDIAQSLKDLGNEDGARLVLEKTFGVLQKEIEERKPFTMTDEDGTTDICNPNSKTMVRVAYVILDILGDKDFANGVVAYSEKYALSFDDNIEIAQYYSRYDENRACIFYRNAEKQAFGFDELYLLCHHIAVIPSQRLWAGRLIDRCLAVMDKSNSENWCIVAEISSRIDRQLSKELFKKGYAVAKTDFERKSLKDSEEMVEEDWTDEERGKRQ